MSKQTKLQQQYKKGLYKYTAGLGVALLILYAMYFAVTGRWFESTALAAFLLVMAAAQFSLQMVAFLHVLDEKKGARWTLWSIIYSFIMMLIIVVASLWIMHNMNYNMHMTPQQMEDFMLEQNKKGF